MTITTRRNATVGWLVLKMWKMVARRQAKRARAKLASLRTSQASATALFLLVGLFAAIVAVLLRLRGSHSPDQQGS